MSFKQMFSQKRVPSFMYLSNTERFQRNKLTEKFQMLLQLWKPMFTELSFFLCYFLFSPLRSLPKLFSRFYAYLNQIWCFRDMRFSFFIQLCTWIFKGAVCFLYTRMVNYLRSNMGLLRSIQKPLWPLKTTQKAKLGF